MSRGQQCSTPFNSRHEYSASLQHQSASDNGLMGYQQTIPFYLIAEFYLLAKMLKIQQGLRGRQAHAIFGKTATQL